MTDTHECSKINVNAKGEIDYEYLESATAQRSPKANGIEVVQEPQSGGRIPTSLRVEDADIGFSEANPAGAIPAKQLQPKSDAQSDAALCTSGGEIVDKATPAKVSSPSHDNTNPCNNHLALPKNGTPVSSAKPSSLLTPSDFPIPGANSSDHMILLKDAEVVNCIETPFKESSVSVDVSPGPQSGIPVSTGEMTTPKWANPETINSALPEI